MPIVSIIIPSYNEQATIRIVLDALYAQTYPHNEMEIVIADGMSSDRTREEIAAFQQTHPELSVVVVDNPKRIIPAGLNQAIAVAKGETILRMDAHSTPRPDYVERCVAALEQGLGDSVGGVWEIRPGGPGWMARGIAMAAAHPLGVGDARYRYTDHAQSVDTVPFGAFRRALLARIGGFDESLLTNEDYEFNVRVRQSGSKIWLDPAIRSAYFARATLKALARQYWRYGYWKARMLRRYPHTIRWRQAIPPMFVLSLLAWSFLGLATPLGWWILATEISVYMIMLIAVGAQMAVKKGDPALVISIPMAIATMHLTWGAALWWSTLKSLVGR